MVPARAFQGSSTMMDEIMKTCQRRQSVGQSRTMRSPMETHLPAVGLRRTLTSLVKSTLSDKVRHDCAPRRRSIFRSPSEQKENSLCCTRLPKMVRIMKIENI